MNTEFDMNKPHQTRDGRGVKELHRFSNGQFVGMLEGNHGVCTWRPNGHYVSTGPCPHDLVNIPTKRTVWVNVYGHFATGPFITEEHADEAARDMTRLGGKAFSIEIEE